MGRRAGGPEAASPRLIRASLDSSARIGWHALGGAPILWSAGGVAPSGTELSLTEKTS